MAVRSPASISSCVSKRVKAPEPAAAGLPDYAHRVVLAGHPAVALRAAAGRFRQAADGSCLVRGFAANRLIACPVKLDRTRYFAISAPPSAAEPRRIRRAG